MTTLLIFKEKEKLDQDNRIYIFDLNINVFLNFNAYNQVFTTLKFLSLTIKQIIFFNTLIIYYYIDLDFIA